MYDNNGGKRTPWHEEQRKILLEDRKSGKISIKKYNEKSEALEKFVSAGDAENKKNSKRGIVLSIVFILITVTCIFVIRETYAGLFGKTIENSTQLKPDTGIRIVGISDSEFIELCKKGSLQKINDAIANRVNVNARDRGLTPLMAAAGDNSDPEVIIALIKAGADVNATNALGRTPLLMAAGNNSNPEAISVLINAGADVNPKTDGNTPLMAVASDNTNPEAISALINAGAEVNVTNALGRTPLLLAARNNPNPEVIKILINAGADVNAQDVDGKTPLIMAADNRNPNSEMITALINAGGDVLSRDKFGLTPLMLVAGNDNSSPEVITAIIKTEAKNNKASINVNARDENGKTPLMEAAQNNSNPKVIITFLQLGANPKLKDDLDKTAIDYARENRRLKDADVLQKLQSKEYNVPPKASDSQRTAMSDYSFMELCKNGSTRQIDSAIKNGANVNARNSMGETPLLLATGNNPNSEVITILVKAGADVNVKNNKGDTVIEYTRRNNSLNASVVRNLENRISVLHSDTTTNRENDSRFVNLCYRGSFQQIHDAIKNGANVNARGSGVTPLVAVASNRDYRADVIRILISSGANVNATGSDGKTPLMAAAEFCSNPEVISALLNYGANAKIKDINNKMAVQYALDNKHLRNTQAVRRLATESNYGIPAGNAPRQDVQKQYAPTEIPPVEMNRVKMKPIEFSSGQNRDKPDSPREGRYSKKTVRYYDNSTRKWKN